MTLVASPLREFWRKHLGFCIALPGILLFMFWAAMPRSVVAPLWMVLLCMLIWAVMFVGFIVEAVGDRVREIWPKVRDSFFGPRRP